MSLIVLSAETTDVITVTAATGAVKALSANLSPTSTAFVLLIFEYYIIIIIQHLVLCTAALLYYTLTALG